MSLQPSASAETIGARNPTAAYRCWAPVYDFFFDLPFQPGRAAAARAAGQAAAAGGELLVVGVGTGLELPLLPRTARVTGIDLSAPMMKIARQRIARLRLRQVKALQVMDAAALEFESESFDVALAPYVMSVVPRPRRVLDEMWRVLRPGGQLVLVNHFSATRGVRSQFEAWLESSADILGWHPQFSFSHISSWLATTPDAMVLERRDMAPFNLFTLLRVKKAYRVSAD